MHPPCTPRADARRRVLPWRYEPCGTKRPRACRSTDRVGRPATAVGLGSDLPSSRSAELDDMAEAVGGVLASGRLEHPAALIGVPPLDDQRRLARGGRERLGAGGGKLAGEYLLTDRLEPHLIPFFDQVGHGPLGRSDPVDDAVVEGVEVDLDVADRPLRIGPVPPHAFALHGAAALVEPDFVGRRGFGHDLLDGVDVQADRACVLEEILDGVPAGLERLPVRRRDDAGSDRGAAHDQSVGLDVAERRPDGGAADPEPHAEGPPGRKQRVDRKLGRRDAGAQMVLHDPVLRLLRNPPQERRCPSSACVSAAS